MGMTNVLSWVSGSGVVQGVIIGATFAFLTAILILNTTARGIATTVNGWSSIRECGQPGNGILVRAACAKALPLVNVFEEAAYWTASTDGSGRRLDGRHTSVLRFPAGQLPPHDAFYSLTVTDTVGYMVAHAMHRSSLDDRSNLVENADGSVDVQLRQTSPDGQEKNWIQTPPGKFKLMLRVYLPGPPILDGSYRVPPVVRVV